MPLDQWTSGAEYDHWMGRWSRLLAHEFLDWLSLPAGLRWIDICCGSGVLAEAIVERSAPSGVVGADASAAQVGFAREHRGRDKLTFELANATSLPFANSSFDVAVCGLGLNYLIDPCSALKEFQRVIRPRGVVAVYVWDYGDGARFLREFWDAAIAVDSDAAFFDQAHRFPMCTPEGSREVFSQAGLEDIETHGLEIITRFSNFEDYWQPFLKGQGSAPNYLVTRPHEVQMKIRERLRAVLSGNSLEVIEMPARAWAARGCRPSSWQSPKPTT